MRFTGHPNLTCLTDEGNGGKPYLAIPSTAPAIKHGYDDETQKRTRTDASQNLWGGFFMQGYLAGLCLIGNTLCNSAAKIQTSFHGCGYHVPVYCLKHGGFDRAG